MKHSIRTFILLSIFFSGVLFAVPEQLTQPIYMSKEKARAYVLEEWFPSWVGGEAAVEGLLGHFDKDATYIDPNVPEGVTGHDALRQFFTVMLRLNPNWKFHLIDVFPTPTGIIIQWKGDVPFGDRLVNLSGVDIIRFNEEGKIQHIEEFFDRTPFREPTAPERNLKTDVGEK